MPSVVEQVLAIKVNTDKSARILCQLLEGKVKSEGEKNLSLSEIHVVSLHNFNAIWGSGFEQFFQNSSGRWANKVLPALRALGESPLTSKIEKIYLEALELYFAGAPVPEDEQERWNMVDSMSKKVNVQKAAEALNKQINELDKHGAVANINKQILTFIKKHKRDFSFAGDIFKCCLQSNFRQKFPGDMEYEVSSDETHLKLHGPTGIENLGWREIDEISIVFHGYSRAGLFPWTGPTCPFSGYSWKFKTQRGEYSVPFYAGIQDSTANQLLNLPGFEGTVLLEQQMRLINDGCRERVCWTRTPDSAKP